MTELEAGGALQISAAQGVVADYRANGDLAASLAVLAQNPATAWAAQLATRDNVTWAPWPRPTNPGTTRPKACPARRRR